jgi:hypothetical protein
MRGEHGFVVFIISCHACRMNDYLGKTLRNAGISFAIGELSIASLPI